MMIYLSRHGEASHAGPDKPSSLTPKGQSDVTLMAEFLTQKKHMRVNAIWHSPKTRAIQTAEIYWKALKNPDLTLEEKKELSPDGDAGQILEDIRGHQRGNLLLVSHLPFLPDLTALLLNGSTEVSTPSYPTTGVAVFEFHKDFKFLWAVNPSLIP